MNPWGNECPWKLPYNTVTGLDENANSCLSRQDASPTENGCRSNLQNEYPFILSLIFICIYQGPEHKSWKCKLSQCIFFKMSFPCWTPNGSLCYKIHTLVRRSMNLIPWLLMKCLSWFSCLQGRMRNKLCKQAIIYISPFDHMACLSMHQPLLSSVSGWRVLEYIPKHGAQNESNNKAVPSGF